MRDDDNFYAAPQAELGPDQQFHSDVGPGGNAPRTFGEAFGDTFKLYSDAFSALFAIAAVWALIYGVCNYLVETRVEMLLVSGQGGFTLIAAYIVLSIGGMYLWIVGLQRVANVWNGAPTGEEFVGAGKKFFPVVAFYILIGMISGVGFIFCIIPGLILGILFFVGDVSMIVENKGPIEGMKRSWNLIKGVENWFFVFGLLMVVSLLVMIPAGFLGAAVGLLTQADPVATNLLGALVTLLTFPLFLCLNYMIYQGLLARNADHFAPDGTREGTGEYGDRGW